MTTAPQERAEDGTFGPKISPVESAETGPAYKPAAPRPEVADEVEESPATLSLLEIATNAVLVPAGAVSMTAATFGTTGLITAATVGLAGGGYYAARKREAIAATAKRAVVERRTTTTSGGQRSTGTAGRAASRSPRSAGRAAFRAGSLGTSKGARKNAAHRARSAAGATRKGEARKAASNAVRAAAARMAGTPARSGAPKRLGGRPGTPLRVVGGTSAGAGRPKAAGRSTGLLKRSAGGGSTKARGGLLKGLKPRGGATGGRVGGRTSLGGSKPTGKKTRRSTDGGGLGKKRPTIGGLRNRIAKGLNRAADKIDNTDTKKAAKRAKRTARRTKWGRFKYVRKATRWLRLRRNALRGLGLITASTAGLATVFKHKDGGPLYRMWQGLHSKTRELLGYSDQAVTARALEAKGRYDAGANTHWRPGTASGAIAGGITINRNNNGGNDMTNVNATVLEQLAEALAVLENYSAQHVGEAGAALTHIGVGETGAKMQQMIAQSMFRMAKHSEQIPHTGPAVAEFLNGSGRGAHSSYEKGTQVAQLLRKRFSVEIERDERGDKSLNVK